MVLLGDTGGGFSLRISSLSFEGDPNWLLDVVELFGPIEGSGGVLCWLFTGGW